MIADPRSFVRRLQTVNRMNPSFRLSDSVQERRSNEGGSRESQHGGSSCSNYIPPSRVSYMLIAEQLEARRRRARSMLLDRQSKPQCWARPPCGLSKLDAVFNDPRSESSVACMLNVEHAACRPCTCQGCAI